MEEEDNYSSHISVIQSIKINRSQNRKGNSSIMSGNKSPFEQYMLYNNSKTPIVVQNQNATTQAMINEESSSAQTDVTPVSRNNRMSSNRRMCLSIDSQAKNNHPFNHTFNNQTPASYIRENIQQSELSCNSPTIMSPNSKYSANFANRSIFPYLKKIDVQII